MFSILFLCSPGIGLSLCQIWLLHSENKRANIAESKKKSFYLFIYQPFIGLKLV